MIKALMALIVVALFSSNGLAQDSTASLGLTGGANLNKHSADFRTLPGVPNCCPRFETGSGVAPAFGALYRLPLARLWALQLSAGYSSLGANLKSTEPIAVAINDNVANAQIEHSVDASIALLSFEPGLRFSLLPGVGINAGLAVGYVLSNNYSQKETLVQPSNVGSFENGSRTRNEVSGSTPDPVKIQFGGCVGASYQLPLNASHSLHLEPALNYTYYFTPLVQSMNWHASSLRAGVDLIYTLPGAEIPVHPPVTAFQPPPAPPVRPMPKLALDLDLVPVNKEGKRVPLSKVRIDDYTRTQLIPLLTYVFFDENSSELPGRYRKLADTHSFHLSADSDAIALYHNMIDVIGQRLRDKPSSTITLIGCNAGMGKEKSDMLSRSRALTVRSYLHDTWGIAENRMKIETRGLPETPSNPNDPDGAAENRRVEIRSKDYSIVQPIILRDTIRVAAPVTLVATTNTIADAGINAQNKGAQMSNRGLPLPAAPDSKIQSFPLSSLINYCSGADLDTFSFQVRVRDSIGQSQDRFASIPVIHATLQRKKEQGSSDTAFSRYNLILFDFDRDDLSDANRETMELIKSRINPGSKVKVMGFADRTGEKLHNQQLSTARAMSASRYLNVPNAEVLGIGSDQLQFDNDTPEGRFYSRTVTINVTSVDAPE